MLLPTIKVSANNVSWHLHAAQALRARFLTDPRRGEEARILSAILERLPPLEPDTSAFVTLAPEWVPPLYAALDDEIPRMTAEDDDPMYAMKLSSQLAGAYEEFQAANPDWPELFSSDQPWPLGFLKEKLGLR